MKPSKYNPAIPLQYLRPLAVVCGMVIYTLLLIELALRGYFSLKVGPDVMLFGTPWCCKDQVSFDKKGATRKLNQEAHDVMYHTNVQSNYSKYKPYQKRRDHNVAGEVFTVTINGQGYRGKDFDVEKGDGVFRVITLGASSTFGYYDKDDETYPYYLEQILSDLREESECETIGKFEVINLGVPHLTSSQILSLLRHEGLALKPDAITLYSGINDAAVSVENVAAPVSGARSSKSWLFIRHYRDIFISIALLDNIIRNDVARYSYTDDHPHINDIRQKYASNVRAMRDLSQTAGAHFFAATQQAKSDLHDDASIRGVTYNNEVNDLKRMVANQQVLTIRNIYLLIHSVLMEDLRWLVNYEFESPLVDVIAATDSRRDYLLSWVHVAPGGNRIIAKEFAGTIFPLACAK